MESEARLIIASGEQSPDLYYRTGFLTPDPYIYAEIGNESFMLLSDLERDRARKEGKATHILSTSEWEEQARKEGKRGLSAIAALFLKSRGISTLTVPYDFPFGLAKSLLSEGFSVSPAEGSFTPQRALKSREEADKIRKVQEGVEQALRTVSGLLRKSTVRDGWIYLEGLRLTSEKVKFVLKEELLGHDLIGQHTIVAGGEQACDPHNEGSGPLPAHLPIVFDIFPFSEKTRYFADMTRTLFKGAVASRHRDLYEAVLSAQERAIAKAAPGVDSSLLHQAVEERFAELGYTTGEVEGRMEGFFHGTGHGVGLEIHEAPRVGKTGVPLLPGHVITVEPGLYYPRLSGGVRIEDMLYITPSGAENLTTYPKDWSSVAIP
ncbi:MAG: Xaa-Pro peptidase family protein [Nitrospirae bacterium]|nr:Xaa-Pro peptidase family protein [Nitrospirota bacterium]MCL5284683.1 Xaa-Pro peptidase family protein [Nitrospirota bacterium]